VAFRSLTYQCSAVVPVVGGDGFNGCFIEPARRGNKPVQPVERMFDKTNRALGALVVVG